MSVPALSPLPFGPCTFYNLVNPRDYEVKSNIDNGVGAIDENDPDFDRQAIMPDSADKDDEEELFDGSVGRMDRSMISDLQREMGDEEKKRDDGFNRSLVRRRMLHDSESVAGESLREGGEEHQDSAQEEAVPDPWASGPCKSKSDCRKRHEHPAANENRLYKLGREFEIGRNLARRQEALWQQYKVHKIVAQHEEDGKEPPMLVCGSVFAGHGQVLWGASHNQRVDLTVISAPGEIQMFNFHGVYYHYKGQHAPSCSSYSKGDSFELDQETRDRDRFKNSYVDKMNEVGHLKFSYTVETECEVFCRKQVPSIKKNLVQVNGKKQEPVYRTVESLLKQEFPQDCIFSPQNSCMTQSSLVSKILRNDPEGDGFVTIVSGTTNHFDKVGKQFSFCQQRAAPRECEIGSFTRQQINDYYGGNEKAVKHKLDSITRTPLTTTKHYYESHGETITTSLLRWLIKKRSFRGFKIIHFLHYSCRDYFRSFLEPRLQQRHDIKTGRADNVPESGRQLLEQALKLLMNG